MVCLLLAAAFQGDLHHLAANGSPEDLEASVRSGKPVDSLDAGKRTPLMIAAGRGREENVRALIHLGADPNRLSSEGSSLHFAVRRGSTGCLTALLTAKANPDPSDKSGRTPLIEACFLGKFEPAQLLIKHGAKPDLADKQGDTPAHWACKFMKADKRDFETDQLRVTCLDILRRAGANLNAKNKKGLTPLMTAAIGDADGLVEFLIDSKVKVAQTDPLGRSALTFSAVYGRQSRTVSSLIAAGLKPTATEYLLFREPSKALRMNLETAPPGPVGESLLALAAECASVEMVKRSLATKVSINRQDQLGWTPLHYAVSGRPDRRHLAGSRVFPNLGSEADRLKIVDLLVKSGAKLIRNFENETPLDLATVTRQAKIVSRLKRMAN
ncbi:MAG TPA: ankyrin repeat domain-containing protein [Fimbriimonadaceae bacterium]|nr:ankyrin repeat domain-containing protein [Fimbriimonadaceae bacterium]